jgi:hypothetical protein
MAGVGNLQKINEGLYRSAQPTGEGIKKSGKDGDQNRDKPSRLPF